VDKVDPVECREVVASAGAEPVAVPSHRVDSHASGARTWTFDERCRTRTIRALKRGSQGKYAGLTIINPEGRYYGVVMSNTAGDRFRDYEGEICGFRLSYPAIRVDFGEPLRCESTRLRAVFDPMVDGVVVYAGDQPVVAFAGPGLRGIPRGLLYLSAPSGLPTQAMEDMFRAEPPQELLGLELGRCEDLNDLEALDVVPNLRTLRIQRSERLESLRGLRHLRRLHTLSLGRCPSLSSIDAVSLLGELQELRLESCRRVHDHSPIRHLESLRRLQLTAVPFNPTLLKGLGSLEKLALNRVDLRQQEAEGLVIPLQSLSNLRSLNLASTGWPRCTSQLAGPTKLQELSLYNNQRIQSVEPLLQLPELRDLDLTGCSGVRDLRTLSRATELRDLSHENEPLAASIVARCATAREDRDHIEYCSRAWCELAKDAPEPDELVQAYARALGMCGGGEWVEAAFGNLVSAAASRNMHDPTTWRIVLEAARQCGGAAMRKAFEAAISSRARLPIAILALAGVPEADAAWARALVERALQEHEGAVLSREVAGAVGWFYRGQDTHQSNVGV